MWMATSSFTTGVPLLLGGLWLGKTIHHSDSYGSGFESGKTMGRYEAEQAKSAQIAPAQVEAWQQMMAGQLVTVQHRPGQGHDGPCSPERGCW